ncbi:hypothetical protein FACS189491_10510 [Spirochaetia bacterium]|nr:hypothetical protein FACS189491_10510 [Spirochaetia bacterium]
MLYRNHISKREEPFHAYVVNQIGVITPNIAKWNIPADAWTAFTNKADPYLSAYTVCQNPNSGPMDTKIRDAARAVLQPALQDLANVHLLYNSAVSDDEKITLGFVLVNTAKEKASKPGTRPTPDVEYGVGMLRIHFRDEYSKHHGKPPKINHLEANYCFSRTRPVQTAEFNQSASISASPLEIRGAENERGETMWFRLRWVGPTTLKGPWSETFSAIMP